MTSPSVVNETCVFASGVPAVKSEKTSSRKHSGPGTVKLAGAAGGFGSVDDTMGDWASRNGCGGSPSTYFDEGDVTCEEWTGCDDGATVRLCTVDGGGHQWPGGATLPGLGSNTDVIVATDAMWDFFEAHSL